ncbi:MAG: glycosyltransferase family 4 protein [Planctomycetaceae bacterium]|nr:glycosyltransferase family 4 protein [Planctomycetaceae bacterium]
MRLLFFSNVFPQPLSPNKGTFNGALVRALARDHLVHVVCPIAWTERLIRWNAAFSAQPILLEPAVTASFPTFWYLPKFCRTKYDWFLERSVRHRVNRDLQAFQPHAVLSYWAHPDAAVAVRIARERAIPAITMVGGSDVLLLGRQGARRTVILKTLHESDAVIAVSQDIAEKLKQDGIPGNKLHVVRRGVEETVFYPGDLSEARKKLGLREDRPLIVGVGRLVPVKDWPTLIEACGLLKKRGVVVDCHLLGGGPLQDQLSKQIAKLGLQDQVTLSGGQPQAVLADWYRAANLVVLPSLSEGVPNVLLEAIACGTPFVASNVGGISEIADPLIHSLVPPGEPTFFANAIQDRLRSSAPLASRRFQPQSCQSSARRVADIIEMCRLSRDADTKSALRRAADTVISAGGQTIATSVAGRPE